MKFKIPATWQECGEIEVEANSLKEAIAKVEENENNDFPISAFDGEYVDDSFSVDTQLAAEIN
jgi:hypothetical protein